MRVCRFLLPSMLFFIVMGLATSAGAETPARKIVVFDSVTMPEAQNAAVHGVGGQPIKSLRLVNATVADLTAGEARALSQRPDVLRVEDDVVVHAAADPVKPIVTGAGANQTSPPGRGKKSTPTASPTAAPSPSPTATLPPTQVPTATSVPVSTPTPTASPAPTSSAQVVAWGVSGVNGPQAWPVSRGNGVKVGIIDTGISLSHPDLKIAGGISEVDYTPSFEDDNGHGSHVAGVVAAIDNGIGVVGVAPSVEIYAIKALDAGGSGYLSDIIDGLDWAIASGIDVVNMSLGTASDVQSFREAISRTYAAGIVMVAAAGNYGPAPYSVNYPAAYSEVIAVGAVNSAGAIASTSSNGPQVDLTAPGVDVYSTYRGTGYATESGTSMASPHVAGVAALRKSLHPSESPSQVAAALKANANLLPGLTTFQQGSGMVDAYRVVAAP